MLELIEAGPARLRAGRLLCVDGPAGSGKSTLAERVAHQHPAAQIVHLDDLLGGWSGQLESAVAALVRDVLTPLAEGRLAWYRRYDWYADEFAEWVPVPPGDLLIVEGVAAGARPVARFAAAVVWVEAPAGVRRERGLARDGDVFAPHWDSWARRETAHFAAERTRSRADLVVDTGA